MKYFLGFVVLLGFFGGVVYGLYTNLSPDAKEVSYVGKCFNESNDNAFIASIKIKISHELGPNKYNVVIYYTKKPETAEEIFLLSQVQQFNNSWASSEQLALFNEVPCD